MSTANDFTRSFRPNAAMSRGRVVAVSVNGYIDLAAVDSGISAGVIDVDTTAGAYENPKVRLWGAGTVMVAVTGTPLTAGDRMVLCTSGFVSVTNGLVGNSGVKVGVLLESAAVSTNGQLREMLMHSPVVT